MTPEVKRQKRVHRLKRLLTGITLAALALLIYLIRDQIAETFSNLGRVNASVLLLIIVWQAINYHSYAMLYKDFLATLGTKAKYWPMYRVALEVNFVNNVFPTAGVSGFSYFGIRMRQFKVSAGKATLIHMLRFVAVFMSFQVLLLIGLLVLAVAGKVSNLTILVASSLATLLFVGTGLLAYIIGSKERIESFFTALTRFLNKTIQLIRPKHPETISISSARKVFLDLHENYLIIKTNYRSLKRPFFYALLANVSEIATIYTVYIAFSSFVNPGAIIIAYVIANFAGLVSVLPGGIGVYEALMTAVLASAGVPLAVAIPATVMYRVLSSAVQLPIGYYFYQKALDGPKDVTK